jgi:uncharacterized protein YkwD
LEGRQFTSIPAIYDCIDHSQDDTPIEFVPRQNECNLFDHSLDSSCAQRITSYSQTNIRQQIAGEILAIGTPQDAMDKWRRDEHEDDVPGVFTQIGPGYAYNSCSDYRGYFAVDLSNN